MPNSLRISPIRSSAVRPEEADSSNAFTSFPLIRGSLVSSVISVEDQSLSRRKFWNRSRWVLPASWKV